MKSDRPRFPSVLLGFVAGILLFFTALITTACESTPPTPTEEPAPPTLPSEVPDAARQAASSFIGAWCSGALSEMYGMLSAEAQKAYSQPQFEETYQKFAEAATQIRCRSSQVGDAAPRVDGAIVSTSINFDTDLFGPLPLDNTLKLVQEDSQWRVDWTPGQVVKGLTDGGGVFRSVVPALRGRILDRTGALLAVSDPMVAIGAVPGEISDLAAFASKYGAILGRKPADIEAELKAAKPEWYVPLGELTPDKWDTIKDQATSEPGLRYSDTGRRRYPQGRSAGNVVGYGSEITAAQLALPEFKNYSQGDWVGQSGLEKWGESKLAGLQSAKLVVTAKDGSLMYTVATRDFPGSQDIYSTIDLGLQKKAEEALAGRRGAIILLEPKTGVIRVMASSPQFDPNIFVTGDSAKRQAILDDPNAPLLNRPAMGKLPPGSTFKIVTMSAAIESGLYTADTRQNCPAVWTGLGPQLAKHDWANGQGIISLHQALVLSCNPYFWDIGLNLFKQQPDSIPNMARQYGFGQSTQIVGGRDDPGQIPDAQWSAARGETWWAGDAVNEATGQGDVLTTPLQIGDMIAAVANDGVIYRPLLADRISKNGGADEHIEPESLATLRLKPNVIADVRSAMTDVISATVGTAHGAFQGFKYSVAGKTGTAETPPNNPHAWFAAYSPVEDPQVVVVVVIENGGEGSQAAAPIARKMLEQYFLVFKPN